MYAVLVGTDSDTGASMLAGTGYIDYRVNGFSIYPRNKIGYIQEREMISNVTSNGHSLCMEVFPPLRLDRRTATSRRSLKSRATSFSTTPIATASI